MTQTNVNGVVKSAGNNSYDVFTGKGWDNWIRITWKDRKWSTTGGNTSLFREAIQVFNQVKGVK